MGLEKKVEVISCQISLDFRGKKRRILWNHKIGRLPHPPHDSKKRRVSCRNHFPCLLLLFVGDTKFGSCLSFLSGNLSFFLLYPYLILAQGRRLGNLRWKNSGENWFLEDVVVSPAGEHEETAAVEVNVEDKGQTLFLPLRVNGKN